MRAAVSEASNGGNLVWKDIAQKVPGRKTEQCRQRWKRCLDPNLRKGNWTLLEDRKMLTILERVHSWIEVSQELPGRDPQQCRERFYNHLDSNLIKGEWTEEETTQLLKLVDQYGHDYSHIRSLMPWRSYQQVRSRIISLTKSSQN